MVIVAVSFPALEVAPRLGLRDAGLQVIRIVVTFPPRREDVLLAAGCGGAVQTRHRAQISRFLARPR